jgi:hypothetical protein
MHVEAEHIHGEGRAEPRRPGPGLLAPESPMREVLVRATALKLAAETVVESAGPAVRSDDVTVSGAALEQLRRALSLWSCSIE